VIAVLLDMLFFTCRRSSLRSPGPTSRCDDLPDFHRLSAALAGGHGVGSPVTG
jgi:hypothetical protein